MGSNANRAPYETEATGDWSATYMLLVPEMTACMPYVPTKPAAVVTLRFPPLVTACDQALRSPVSNPSEKGVPGKVVVVVDVVVVVGAVVVVVEVVVVLVLVVVVDEVVVVVVGGGSCSHW